MATVRVTQTKCPECSASLKITGDAESTRCEYCGTTLHVEKKRPPRNPTMTQPRTVYVPPPTPFGAKLAMVLGPFIPIVIVATQLWPMIRGYIPILGNQLPTECGLNGRVSISKKTFTGQGTLIKAGTNCTITISDSQLEGDVIVEGGVNVAIEIERSSLTGRKRAITSGVNTKLKIVGKSTVKGEKAALDLGSNAEVTLDDSTLASPGIALKADSNLSLDADGGEINGGAAAIDASGWARKLDLDGTKLVGAKKAKTSH